jgi:hypothetical protein
MKHILITATLASILLMLGVVLPLANLLEPYGSANLRNLAACHQADACRGSTMGLLK